MARKRKDPKTGITESLREAILASGMTSYRLAKMLGLSPIAIDRFVRGERGLSVNTADKLCDVLGLGLCQVREIRKEEGRELEESGE